MALNRKVASLDGPIISVLAAKPGAASTKGAYDIDRLLDEYSISTNTAAAGGNASLMTIG
jgi:RHH-type proline utilization regulon transcriptional repressor/proline dehydrogenase/delta 1-pyrroline-5-carboxylate dehydrogenase